MKVLMHNAISHQRSNQTPEVNLGNFLICDGHVCSFDEFTSAVIDQRKRNREGEKVALQTSVI